MLRRVRRSTSAESSSSNVDTATSVSAVRKLYGISPSRAASTRRWRCSSCCATSTRGTAPAPRYLWERGWQEFQHRNYSGAVGYWTAARADLPRRPGHASRQLLEGARPRGARRAPAGPRGLPRGGRQRRHGGLLRAGRRRAARRRRGARPAAAAACRRRGRRDPCLRRVLVLSNFGLDALAELELDAGSAETAPSTSATCWRCAASSPSRQGDPRKGVQLLRAAFPDARRPVPGGRAGGRCSRPTTRSQYEQAIARATPRSRGCRRRWWRGSSARRAPSTARPELGRRARPDADHAGDGQGVGRPARPRRTRPSGSTTPSTASASAAPTSARCSPLRRQRRAGARRLQRRPQPHPAPVERGRRPRGQLDLFLEQLDIRSPRPTSSASWCSPTATVSSTPPTAESGRRQRLSRARGRPATHPRSPGSRAGGCVRRVAGRVGGGWETERYGGAVGSSWEKVVLGWGLDRI